MDLQGLERAQRKYAAWASSQSTRLQPLGSAALAALVALAGVWAFAVLMLSLEVAL